MRVGDKYIFVDTDFNDGRVDLPRNIQLVKYIADTGNISYGKGSFGCADGLDGYLVKYWYEQDGEIKTTFIAHYDNDKVTKCETIITRKDILENYKKAS